MFAAVALLHLVVVLALIRAFAPDLTGRVVESAVSVFTVAVTAPPPQPSLAPVRPKPEGAAGDAGRKAVPKEAAAPRPKVAIAENAAPPAASKGDQVTSGARETGAGAGAGGEGSGTGSGRGGQGQGGGGASKAVKIAGDINSARDYPRETEELRIGDYVIVALTVGTDGRVRDCRIHRASRDAEADRITCRLATRRFRFRPATDASGNPVESVYGWQQRWFYREDKN